jgi:hypothetical protein
LAALFAKCSTGLVKPLALLLAVALASCGDGSRRLGAWANSEAVNPKHCGGAESPYEAIKVIEAWGAIRDTALDFLDWYQVGLDFLSASLQSIDKDFRAVQRLKP